MEHSKKHFTEHLENLTNKPRLSWMGNPQVPTKQFPEGPQSLGHILKKAGVSPVSFKKAGQRTRRVKTDAIPRSRSIKRGPTSLRAQAD